ncbi:MAG TPA: asparagine--tRNA ligase [Buchnera sp. (in: enterobacteria)]|nr:asparagine--tRNA ligase [Buchnera sp. (in: enterobacteria)]
MSVVSIKKIHQHQININSIIIIQGWVKNKRDSKSGRSFIDVYDGSCLLSIQVIADNMLYNYKEEILYLTSGCSVSISGQLVHSLGKKQKYDILVKSLQVIGWVKNPNTYPISAKKHTIEYLRENVQHLRSRTNFIGAMTRVRHVLVQALHKFFDAREYYLISTPIITNINTEGAGAMFKVSTLDFNNIPKQTCGNVDFKKDFFKKESFLTVSGQLTLETYACALSKVYNLGPVFRAENSNTSRHLSEFWMLEAEQAFCCLQDIQILSEEMLKYVIALVLQECKLDIHFFKKYFDVNIENRLQGFLEQNFIQVEYEEVIDILLHSKINFKNHVFFGINLFTEHEKYIVEKYFKKPVIIINYPKNVKAFYMRLNDDKKTVAAMDILLPGIGEILGGSQREERIHILDDRILESGLKKKDYWWYRDLRHYGTVPHSGFGLGIERLVSYITGIKNIRDVIPFPRTIHHADF